MVASHYKAPTSKAEVKELYNEFGIKANTNIGQHFLTDTRVLDTIIKEYSEHKVTDTVLEIGPGLGVLTERLVSVADRVISVELDRKLEPILHKLETQYTNLTVVRKDILRTPLHELGLESGKFTVVANLPYQITSQFIRAMLTIEPYPDRMILLVQREVAERIVAEPGQMSILALSVQLFSTPEIISIVPPHAFFPPPRVFSAVLAINSIRKQPFVEIDREKALFRLIKAGFAQKRKLLRSNLRNINHNGKNIPLSFIDDVFTELQIEKNTRAQEISLEMWLKLLDKIESFVI